MKKLYFLLIFLCFFAHRSKAQWVDVGWEFQQIITATYPQSASSFNQFAQMDTTSAFVTTLHRMDIHGFTSDPFSLGGIQYFDNLRYLDCSGNSIENLGPLPALLDTLICSNQQWDGTFHWTTMSSLPTFPAGLKYLDCSMNGITSITSLPPALRWLDCSFNYFHMSTGAILPTLGSLPSVLPSSLVYLKCSSNGLTSLPPLPSSLEFLDCGYNRLYFDDGFTLWFYPGIASLPSLPPSLNYLDASYNNLAVLPVLPNGLAYLNCRDDSSLNCLPQLPASMGGTSPYSSDPFNLKTSGTNITCLPNTVAGLQQQAALPVCDGTNNPNGCNIGISPALSAGPSINGLQTTPGTASGSVAYSVFGYNLNPAAGSITITPSAFIEISTDNINFSASPLIVGYTGGQLSATQIFVRISSAAVLGVVSGTVTNSGGGASNAVITVNGEVVAAFMTAGPSVNGLIAPANVPSSQGVYLVNAMGLVPASGNIAITASSVFEVSLDNVNYSTSVSLAYTNGSITGVPVYVRISATSSAGAVSGNVVNSGGGVADAIVTVSGQVNAPQFSAYYDINGLNTTVGVASTAGAYQVFAAYLNPPNGDITITPSPGLEVSTDDISYSSSITTSYNSFTNETIFVRISSTAPAGPIVGTITNTAVGAGVPDAIINVSGNVIGSPSPIITAGPDISGLNTIAGTASASIAYNLSAGDLSPASGNITITPTSFLEVSSDNTSFSSSPITVAYTAGGVASTPVYVRISSSAAAGTVSGTITNSGGGAANAVVNVNGNVTAAPVPVLVAGPDIGGLSTVAGTASASTAYNLSGSDLVPVSGNITITPGSFLEVSTDNINFSSSASVAYTSGTLSSTSVYVRISSGAPAGTVSGTITNSGGGAANAVVNVNGNVTAAPVPVLVAGPDIGGLSTVAGTASASTAYNLSGSDLVPGSGNITITPGSFLEVSTDNINFSSSASVAYTSGTLSSTSVYVRMSSGAPAGVVAGTVVNSGGGAANAIVNVNGNVTAAPTPVIVVGPDISGLSTNSGTASASAPYTLSAHDLVPASGTITITASSFLEISTDNVNFSASPITIGYASGLLPATTIYVRISASAAQGAVSGTVTNSGGGATDAIVSVSGSAARIFNSIVLYPNPASGNVTVYLPGNYSPAFINIYDRYGRLMKTVSSSNESVPVKIAGLSKGVYTIKIVKDGAVTGAKNLVVE